MANCPGGPAADRARPLARRRRRTGWSPLAVARRFVTAALLAGLLVGVAVGPARAETPAPTTSTTTAEPTSPASPTEGPTESEGPTETASPTESESASESPSPTASPSPTESPTPTPSLAPVPTTGRAAVPWGTVVVAVLVLAVAGVAITLIVRRRHQDEFDQDLSTQVAAAAWLDRIVAARVVDPDRSGADVRTAWSNGSRRFADTEQQLVRVMADAPTPERRAAADDVLAGVTELHKALDDHVRLRVSEEMPGLLNQSAIEVRLRRERLAEAIRGWQSEHVPVSATPDDWSP